MPEEHKPKMHTERQAGLASRELVPSPFTTERVNRGNIQSACAIEHPKPQQPKRGHRKTLSHHDPVSKEVVNFELHRRSK